ncbi:MAG: dTMP kinase [Chloroflexota bacterium]
MFITLEGPEGCGKTSQIALLGEFLRQQGRSVVLLREPGGTTIGDQVRAVLLSMKNQEMCTRTEILLFQASRAQLVEQVIRPRLAQGDLVLCDRYADSTLAYQGYGYQKFHLAELKRLVDFATGGLKPDLTLLLDVDVETGLQRRMQGGGVNRLDALELDFHRRVRQGYLEMARAEPQRWEIIDAGQSLEDVQQALRQVVTQRLQLSWSPESGGPG